MPAREAGAGHEPRAGRERGQRRHHDRKVREVVDRERGGGARRGRRRSGGDGAFVGVKASNAPTALLLGRVYGAGRLDDRAVVAATTRRARLALAPLWGDRAEADALRCAGLDCAALEGVVHAAIAEDPRLLLDPVWCGQLVALTIGAVGALGA